MEQTTPQLLEQYKVPGAALALVRDGEVVWSQGYGLADKARGIPVTDDTIFQVASVSKAVTSWGVMRLVAAEMPGPECEAGRGVLAPETLALMFKPVIKTQPGMGEDLGQSVATLPDGSKVIQHGGANKGWLANIMANPQWGVGVVTLTNSDNGADLIGAVVFRELLPLLLIERVLLILVFVLSAAILVDALFIVRKWIKVRNSV